MLATTVRGKLLKHSISKKRDNMRRCLCASGGYHWYHDQQGTYPSVCIVKSLVTAFETLKAKSLLTSKLVRR